MAELTEQNIKCYHNSLCGVYLVNFAERSITKNTNHFP